MWVCRGVHVWGVCACRCVLCDCVGGVWCVGRWGGCVECVCGVCLCVVCGMCGLVLGVGCVFEGWVCGVCGCVGVFRV